jgi:GNAT superfamily N-acetyltransferase
VNIRAAVPADLEPIVAIRNAVWPEYPLGKADLVRFHGFFPASQRFVLERDGAILAHALIDPQPGNEAAKLELDVLPDAQGQGMGTAFARWLGPYWGFYPRLTASVPEGHSWALGFATARGFREVSRSWHQVLEPERFDGSGFAGLEAGLAAQGYSLHAYPEIADPAKLYALYAVTSRDVPGTTALPSFAEYRQRVLENASTRLEAYLIAVRDSQWVGYTATRQRAQDRPLEWHTGMTGVLREHRGHGLATALKVRVIELARATGILELHTNNDSLNEPMLGVNRRLGYRRVSGTVYLERRQLEHGASPV